MGIKFVQTQAMGGDCTAPFNVLYDEGLTLRDLIDTISKRGEWGYIDILTSSNKGLSIEYCGNKTLRIKYHGRPTLLNVLDDVLDNFLDSNVINVKAHGGWGRMDYKVIIDD